MTIRLSADDPIPRVCLIEDVCRALRVSRRTLKRLRRAKAFPIQELPSLDKHPRWRGSEIQKFIDGPLQLPRGRR
jgi:hypothetical protein